MDGVVYLPFVSGLLTAYAKSFPELRSNYEFMPPLYARLTPDEILAQYVDPAVACFSVSMWNYALSIEVAKRIKWKFPECVIIFGGPSAPFEGKIPEVDYIINGEGEKKFVNILAKIAGLYPQVLETQEKNLDIYPSPYVSGEYERIIKDDINFQAIVETNRGCPFNCTYCFWGMAGLNKQFRFHSLDFIRGEADWIGRNKIKYVFCADSNFGMFKRDVEIAQIWADTKAKYGYPKKFRVCYGKNAQESIYETAKVLSGAGLAKAITISKQTNNPKVLENVRRANISSEVYDSLQRRYMAEGIPTYVEIILGLPGETLQSFKDGVEAAMRAGTQLFIYHCSVLPNTEMAKPEYLSKYGIKTARVPMSEIHCQPRPPGSIQEYEDIIIETATMSQEDWIKAAVYSWETQLKYSLGVDLPENETISAFFRIAHEITQGKPRGQLDPMFGNIYWEPEEMAYLKMKYNGQGDPKEFAKKEILYGRKSRCNLPNVRPEKGL